MKSNSGVAFLAIIMLLLLTSSLLVIVVLANEVTLAQAKKKKPLSSSSSLSHHSTTTITTPNASTSNTLNAFQQSQQQSQSLLPYEDKNQQGTIFNGLNNGSKVVIITFGDGLESQYLYAKPILDKYGFKANFFVTCNKVGLMDSKITWQELAQLYNEGHVIGSKTMNYGTKAMQNKDLNHLSANDLEYEVGQSKQCLLDHGINTTVFAVPKNVASDNETVVNTISKYYDFAINGHSNLTDLHANRYSIGEYSMQHIRDNGSTSYDNSQMFSQFVAVVNSQNEFNKDGVINAIPVIGYHEIIPAYTDVSYTNKSSDIPLDLFEAEMKYLHDNDFRVITFYDLGPK